MQRPRRGSDYYVDGRRVGLIVFEDPPGARVGVISMSQYGPSMVIVHLIQADTPQRGAGSRMLHPFCEEADKRQVTLRAQPAPQDNAGPPIPMAKLQDWYRRYGFAGTYVMERSPHASSRPAAPSVQGSTANR